MSAWMMMMMMMIRLLFFLRAVFAARLSIDVDVDEAVAAGMFFATALVGRTWSSGLVVRVERNHTLVSRPDEISIIVQPSRGARTRGYVCRGDDGIEGQCGAKVVQ